MKERPDEALTDANDPHDLRRFVDAQSSNYDQALSEIRAGRKRTHWMWYVFPQYDGLGRSPAAQRYSIKSVAEADAYLRHSVLGPRLLQCAEAVLDVEGRTAHAIFGSPDDAKLRSSATLFSRVASPGSAFHRILDRCFAGQPDRRTLELIEAGSPMDDHRGGTRGPT